MAEQRISFCRNCAANCGVAFEVENNAIVASRPDRQNPFSQGFMCIKGEYAVELHRGDDYRLTESQTRVGDHFEPIGKTALVDEIAAKLAAIIAEDGPEAVAAFYGTCAYQKGLTVPTLKNFLASLGSPKIFSTMTIDQSAFWVADGRLGVFATGKPALPDLDTVVLIGTNPIVSHGNVSTPIPNSNQLKHINAFKAHGGKLVVIDPRRTETASRADLFVQPVPGQDGAIVAALIGILLANDWHDRAFCDRWVINLDALREAVAPFTPEMAAARAGIAVEQIHAIAELLRFPRRAAVGGSTGISMSPESSGAVHLMLALNAICGGYARAGDRLQNPGVLSKKSTVEGVFPPSRSWERGPKLRSGHGQLYGEFPTSRLPDDILTDGPGRVRALFVVGGNPMKAIGDPERTRAALERLDLLVVIDPRMTDTAAYADYVVAPPLQFEVHDFGGFCDHVSPIPFIQYAPPVIDPPAGTYEEWKFFHALAERLGIGLEVKPFQWSVDIGTASSGLRLSDHPGIDTPEIIDWQLRSSGLSRDLLAANPHGLAVDAPEVIVGMPEHDDGARLDLCPPDVAAEVARIAAAPERDDFRYLLTSRRVVDTMNSAFRDSARVRRRHPTNTLFMHPDDMAADGIPPGAAVKMEGRHGAVGIIAKADATMRRGVVSMTHCWGSTSSTLLADRCVSWLVSLDEDVTVVDAMPQQSAIAVNITPLDDSDKIPQM